MGITTGWDLSVVLPIARSRRRVPLPRPHLCSRVPAGPPLLRLCRATSATPPTPLDDGEEPRQGPLDLALLLVAAAWALAASPHVALAASGGAMGGRSYSSSSRSSSSTPSSSSSSYSSSRSSSTPSTSSSSYPSSRPSSSSSYSSPPSSSSYSSSPSSSSSYSLPPVEEKEKEEEAYSSSALSSYSSSSPSSSSWLSSSSSEQQTEATHLSVGTAEPPRVLTAAERDAAVQLGGYLASASIGAVALFLAVRNYTRPRTTVIKLQVALLGLAKSFQKDLNEIADKVEASNQRWYKFILTETICSLRRHNSCCISSSLSVDVKDRDESWEQHFDKLSIEERRKFDEETLYNLEGIKRKKTYSKKPDGFRNEYIVLTILVAADGALKFPEVRNYADLEEVAEKLNSISARQIQGIQVLWSPQEENDVLSEEKLLEDYPYLKPLSDE